MINRDALARFGKDQRQQPHTGSKEIGFDLDSYVALHGFEVTRRKTWELQPGGLLFELAQCPFNKDHIGGSAAFTLVAGAPGFVCKHNGCHGKALKDVFAMHPPAKLTPKSAPEGEEKRTQAQILCELAGDAKFFHTSEGGAYARVRVGDHHETWALRSKEFRRWLVREFHKQCKKPPGAQGLQDAIGLLEARAQFDWPEAALFVRIGESGGALYIDLCNQNWEAVEIRAEGWRVVGDPPIRFRRSRGMLSLPYPVRGGSVALLRSLINIGDDNNWLLCLSWLAAAYRPKGPYPVLILQGEQGSAKSTTAKLLRRLVDPSAALVRTPPRNERDLLIAASNSWVLAYDNVSGIPLWLSDSLCRVATGGGFTTRELFTDSDEVFFEATRPIILNGIDHLADRPDLADRALIISVPHIDRSNRRQEAEIYAEFESALPQILGGLCDVVTAGLARRSQINLRNKPRMADFAVWGMAVAPAFGFESEVFLTAYGSNRADAVLETLEGETVATAILALMNARTENDFRDHWEGTCQELLHILEPLADDATRRAPDWPKTPRALSSRLRRLVTFLREAAVEITFPPKGAKGRRPVTITRTRPDLTAATAAVVPHNPNDSSDQSHAAERPGGGGAAEVADQPQPIAQPPPPATSSNGLKGQGKGAGAAVVAEVAVLSSPVLKQGLPTQPASARTDLCAHCGRVEWQWVNSAWVCPICGELANGQPRRERIEI